MRNEFVASLLLAGLLGGGLSSARGDEPQKGAVKRADLGGGTVLETVYIPLGEFLMGSTPEEKLWATGIEGGAQAGTVRESYEGPKPRR